MMNRKYWFGLGLAFVMATLLMMPGYVSADNLGQALYQTPTAQDDGRIIYVVKEGENCLSISLLTGVSIDDLRSLNNLGEACEITTGQELLLGIAGPSPTPGPTATSGPVVPTATPFNGNGDVCIEVYEDVNGDALRQDTEILIADAVISLTDVQGNISKTAVTSSTTDSVCFTEIPEGEYNVSVAIPDEYNPTTVMFYAFKVKAGDQAILNFGAQVSTKAAVEPTISEGGHSPLLGLIGVVLLLIGVGMGVYVIRSRK
jgi:hypothetical protein